MCTCVACSPLPQTNQVDGWWWGGWWCNTTDDPEARWTKESYDPFSYDAPAWSYEGYSTARSEESPPGARPSAGSISDATGTP